MNSGRQAHSISFKVIHATSADEGYSEHELEDRHSKRGWRSSRFCYYPQDLVLEFDDVYEIRELRILSHQSKIAAKIHVSAGVGKGIKSARFKGLGCMKMDPNTRSGYKARELKKVRVQATGNFLKLSVLKSHINELNVYNQVAIVAVQVKGLRKHPSTSTDPGNQFTTRSNTYDPDSGAGRGGDRYEEMDSKTEHKIRVLEDMKARAIEDEEYDKAKKLKQAIQALKKIGPHLAMLERKKKEAVQREDYDTAMAIKKEITRIRSCKPTAPPPQPHSDQYPAYHVPHHTQSNVQRTSSFHGDYYDQSTSGFIANPQHRPNPNFNPSNPGSKAIRVQDHKQISGGMGMGMGQGGMGPAGIGPAGFGPVGVGSTGMRPAGMGLGGMRQGGSLGGMGVGPGGLGPALAPGGMGPKGMIPKGMDTMGIPNYPMDDNARSGNLNTSVNTNPNSNTIAADERPLPALANKQGGGPMVGMGARMKREEKPGGEGAFTNERPLPALNKGNGMAADPNDDRPLPNKSSKKHSNSKPNQSNPFEDRPLPALSNKKGQSDPFGGAGGRGGGGTRAEGGRSEGDDEPMDLSEKDKAAAQHIITAFGERIAKCLFDSRWSIREMGMKDLRQMITDSTPGERVKTFGSLISVIKKLIKDKVPSISIGALELLDHGIKETAGSPGPDPTIDKATSILPLIFTKLNTNNSRLRLGAKQAVELMIDRAPSAPEKVAKRLLKPVNKKEAKKPLVLKSRGELLVFIMDRHRLNKALGLGVEPVMKAAMPLLEHRDAKVRDTGISIVARLHSIVGMKYIRPLLKPLSKGTRDTLLAILETNKPLPPHNPSDRHTTNKRGSSRNPAGKEMKATVKKPVGHGKRGGSKAGVGNKKDGKDRKTGKTKSSGNKQAVGVENGVESSADFAVEQEGAVSKIGEREGNEETLEVPNVGEETIDESGDLAEEPEGYCQFCEFQDPNYDEVKMDLHYWRECPMLISCDMCEQVVEIASYSSHLVEECDKKEDYIKCTGCQMSVRKAEQASHRASGNCRPAPRPEVASRCPLCFKDIPPWEEGWKKHLLDEKCANNPRTNGSATKT